MVSAIATSHASHPVPPRPRADPALAPLPDPSRRDTGLLGRPEQIGRKGLSNHPWIIEGKRCLLLNQ